MVTPPSYWEYRKRADNPRCTVVISTVPGNDHTTVCEHLQQTQTFQGEWDIIAVNDPELDRCEARNFGLQESDAPYVAFTDDDTRPPDEWIETIVATFEENPNAVCLEGPVSGGITYDGERQYVGCNMAVDRDAARSIGGWNSRYAGWREDTEFGWRMEAEADGDCLYVPEMEMYHPDSPRTHYDHRLETLLKEKYPQRYEEVLDTGLIGRLWRKGQQYRIVPYVNVVRNMIRSVK